MKSEEQTFKEDLITLKEIEILFYNNLDFCRNNVPEKFDTHFLDNLAILENNICLFVQTYIHYDKKFSKNKDYREKVEVFDKMDKDFWDFKSSLNKNLFH